MHRLCPADSGIKYEEHLNPEQLQVVMHPGGPMLVIAGAGTGKTRTLTYRVIKLLDTGIPKHAILLLTFTNRAAKQMLHRVATLLNEDIKGLWGGTFHHICHLILRRHASAVGFKDDFTIIDREDQKELLDTAITEVIGEDVSHPRGSVLAEIYSLKNSLLMDTETLLETRYPQFLSLVEEIKKTFHVYETKKHHQNLMDFDDLLLNTLKLLKEHDELRVYYASRFEHILVDEYQDTNQPQIELIDLLASVHRNLMVVGDDAQSIYSFRGASVQNILNFQERYPDAKVFMLTINYRSTPEILALANDSIRYNKKQFHKSLVPVKPSGVRPVIISTEDLLHQASVAVNLVERLLAERIPARSIAILYRSHYQSMECQIELQRRGIPYEVRSGLRFFEQAHIKDILSFLRILHNPYDELSWKRILKMLPGVGQVTANKLWERISTAPDPYNGLFNSMDIVLPKARDAFRIFCSILKNAMEIPYKDTPEEVIRYILDSIYEQYLYNNYPNAESRYEDIKQLIQYMEVYQAGNISIHNKLELILSDLSLERTEMERADNGIVLSSIHQAKGLEWHTVILIGLNDGRFPSRKALWSEGEEEERRLFYVACTRAMEELYILYSRTDNGYRTLPPSRFLTELSEQVYQPLQLSV